MTRISTWSLSIPVTKQLPEGWRLSEIWEMAIRGQGGYRIISDRWDDFNKQIGNALELEDLPRKTLERFQLEAYLRVYFNNWRFGELAKVVYQHRRRLYYKVGQLLSPRRRLARRMLVEDACGATQPEDVVDG